MSVGRSETKIIVVLAGKGLGGDNQAEYFACQPCGFRFCDRLGRAHFGNHTRNLIRKGQSASILAGCELMRNARDAPRFAFNFARSKPAKSRVYISSREDWIETGPFTVESLIIAGELPYSMRRLLSSQVFRALSQMLAWQLIGE